MKLSNLKAGILAFAAFTLASCAPTNVTVVDQTSAQLPRPDKVYIYNFAVSPDEITLDSGISGRVQEHINKTPRTEEERTIGHTVANALASNLVQKLQNLGIVGERVAGTPPHWGNILEIQGQFISIDEGNQAERVVIGLGIGRTDVKTFVQVLDARKGKRTIAIEFDADAKSGYKPGMAETMGAGAVAGHIGAAVAVGTGLAVGSEAFTANVEADAKRMAQNIAKQIGLFYVAQGWLPPGSVQ
jgi:hypothetical protein